MIQRELPLSMNLPQKAGASSTHSKRFRAVLKVPELREAFGVRPACWRFRFTAPMRGSEIVEAFHEPSQGFEASKDSFPIPERFESVGNPDWVHGPNSRQIFGGFPFP